MSPTLDQDFSHLQDVFGTLPMVKRYVVLCLFFALDDLTTTSQIETLLQDALGRLAEAFPYLAGQVVYEGRDETKNQTGVPKIVPFASTIQLITKDLRSSFPSMSELELTRYPFSSLDPAILAPPRAVSWSSDPHTVTAPVLILQANFITGGLILTISGNHTQMDMTGMGQMIAWFAQACRSDPFTPSDLEQGNQPRGNAIPLFDKSWTPGPELDDVTAKPPNPEAPDPLACNPRWAYFHFNKSNLTRLKGEASTQTIVPYISTDDAIAALCWQRLSRVRNTTTPSTFARPHSVRKHFNLTSGYTGHLADCVNLTLPSVHEQQFPDVAGHLRLALSNSKEIKYHAQAYATQLSRLSDKNSLVNGANLDPSRDFVLSSYANIRCCELVFGALGRPLAARRPRMPVWPSLCYLMPKDVDGGIVVAFCVGEADLERLKEDEIFGGFADFVG